MKAGYGFGSGGSGGGGGGANAEAFATGTPQTLTDGATTNVVVGDTTLHKSIAVTAYVERGSDSEGSEIDIIINGAGVIDDCGEQFGDVVGLTLASTVVGTDIVLQCTLTSTGTDATIYFSMVRTLISP